MAKNRITNPTMGRAVKGFANDVETSAEAAPKKRPRSRAIQDREFAEEAQRMEAERQAVKASTRLGNPDDPAEIAAQGDNPQIPEEVTQEGEAVAAAAINEELEDDGLTDEERQAKIEEDRAQRLLALGDHRMKELSDWRSWRTALGVDANMAEDLDFYNGKDNQSKRASEMMDSVEQGYPVTTREARPTRSTVFVGVTRSKTNAAEARLADILLPTDDRNWGIKPTPIPELAAKLKDDSPVPPQQAGAPALPGQQGAAPLQPAMLAPAAPAPTQGMNPPGAGIDPNAPVAALGQPGGMQAPQPQPQQMPGAPGMPGMVQPLDENGQALRKSQVAQAIEKQAQLASDAMQKLIEDQLSESDYNGETRKMLHWAAVVGTGILKGPLVANRFRKAWVPYTDVKGNTTYVLKVVEETAPVSVCVDPRNVFTDPDAGDEPQRGSGIYEVDLISAKDVRDLAKQPGYMTNQLRMVLKSGPKAMSGMDYALFRDRVVNGMSQGYERVQWWGEITAEDLRCCMDDEEFEAAMAAKGSDYDGIGEDDSLVSFSACLIMINGIVVKAFLNPLETESLPYDFFQWEKVNDQPWGIGVPRLMNSQQRVINAAWRMMMDNAGVSSGPQIIMNRELVSPADGRWEITGRKVWWAKGDTLDVEKAFQVFNIDSNQQGLQAIIEMALKLVDDDTGVPAMLQGDNHAAPETLGGMQLLFNAANVVLRRLVKRFDDDITRPHITRYYDYNMEHSADESVKGDMNVDARGTSALLVRDIQNQALLQILQAYPSNPMLQAVVKPKELVKKVLTAQHIETEQLTYSDGEIDQNFQKQAQAAQQQGNPQVQAAQIRAEAQVVAAKAQAQGDLAEIEQRRVMAEANNATQMAKLELERDLMILKLASEQKISIEKIKAELAKTAMNNRTQKETFIAEAGLKQQFGTGI